MILKSSSKYLTELLGVVSNTIRYRYEPIDRLKHHLPFTLHSALREVRINRLMDKRIREGWYADKLVLIAAIPKSASSVIGSCIAEIVDKPRTYAPYMIANEDSELRPEMVCRIVDGAVIKYHTHCSSKNLNVLELLKNKYVILLRHPADQLAALYCHYQRTLASESRSTVLGSRWVYDHIYPIDRNSFVSNRPDQGLKHLINDGYLNAVLNWTLDWLRFRDSMRSIVVRYEDFVADQEEFLSRLATFLTGNQCTNEVVQRCKDIASAYAASRDTDESKNDIYPRGWTGQIGTWRSYFTPENKEDYQERVKVFLKYQPNASLLLDAYPNLLDIDQMR